MLGSAHIRAMLRRLSPTLASLTTTFRNYSLVYLDPKGNVSGALMLSCTDDAEAVATFDEFASDRAMELWHRSRRIKTYSPATEA